MSTDHVGRRNRASQGDTAGVEHRISVLEIVIVPDDTLRGGQLREGDGTLLSTACHATAPDRHRSRD